MADIQKMCHCPLCDVFVGVFEDELVVVTGDTFRACLDGYARACDPHVAEVYEPIAWVEDAESESDQYAWFEPDESRKSWGWYRGRSLEESHDHFLWLELVSR
jgi:hypothetical protein